MNVFIRLFKMSAGLWKLRTGGGGSLQHCSVNAPLMICLKTFNIIIMLIRMETLRSLEMHSEV